ncbi:MAG: MazG family protein [Actinomycetota bacterium]
MPLLVVPIAPDEAGSLTLAEWDALRACEKVLFERPDHPLAARLRAAGVQAGPFDDDPAPDRDGWALVADPSSPRVVELARGGADVSSGVAPSPDPLTAAHGAYLARRGAASLGALALVMARLRSEDGCPWDREQSHESLRVHLLEEAYEVLDSIDRGETGIELEEELGDVLLQVAFHSQLAKDDDRFDMAGVADRIVAKLLHRHPHVFGETTVADAAEVIRNWESIKADEKKREGPFEGLPEALPALLLAYKTQKRAAGVGFEAGAETARKHLDEALTGEVDIGEALFWLVALARAAGVDPEGALRNATRKFREVHE